MSECLNCPEHCPIDAEIVEDPVNLEREAYTDPPVIGPCTCYRNLSFHPEKHAGYCPVRQWTVEMANDFIDAVT